MKVARIVAFALMLLSAARLALSRLLPLLLGINVQQAGSIGVIGGADGPTSIYVAGKLSPVAEYVPIALFVILLAVWLILRHKSKDR